LIVALGRVDEVIRSTGYGVCLHAAIARDHRLLLRHVRPTPAERSGSRRANGRGRRCVYRRCSRASVGVAVATSVGASVGAAVAASVGASVGAAVAASSAHPSARQSPRRSAWPWPHPSGVAVAASVALQSLHPSALAYH